MFPSFPFFNYLLQYVTHHSPPWQWVWTLVPLFLFSTTTIILNFITNPSDKRNGFAVASLSGMSLIKGQFQDSSSPLLSHHWFYKFPSSSSEFKAGLKSRTQPAIEVKYTWHCHRVLFFHCSAENTETTDFLVLSERVCGIYPFCNHNNTWEVDFPLQWLTTVHCLEEDVG